MKYYAVRTGRDTGIFTTWAECAAAVRGYSGAVFKSFEDEAAARDFLLQAQEPASIKEGLPFAYIDGTFSKTRGVYGWGGFICDAGKYYIIQGTGDTEKYRDERNIAGELLGALNVLFKAQKLGIKELNLFADLAGIKYWKTREWKANTPLTQYYRDMTDLMSEYVTANVFLIKGHTGIEGNELADLLAKDAIGAKITKKAAARLAEFRQQAQNGTNGRNDTRN